MHLQPSTLSNAVFLYVQNHIERARLSSFQWSCSPAHYGHGPIQGLKVITNHDPLISFPSSSFLLLIPLLSTLPFPSPLLNKHLPSINAFNLIHHRRSTRSLRPPQRRCFSPFHLRSGKESRNAADYFSPRNSCYRSGFDNYWVRLFPFSFLLRTGLI
jgi:hypothetical protein